MGVCGSKKTQERITVEPAPPPATLLGASSSQNKAEAVHKQAALAAVPGGATDGAQSNHQEPHGIGHDVVEVKDAVEARIESVGETATEAVVQITEEAVAEVEAVGEATVHGVATVSAKVIAGVVEMTEAVESGIASVGDATVEALEHMKIEAAAQVEAAADGTIKEVVVVEGAMADAEVAVQRRAKKCCC
jgi:hypothetical protein